MDLNAFATWNTNVQVMLKDITHPTEQYIATSSAKIFIGELTADGKSLMYNIKSKGPKMEPCGTPDSTRDQSEE